jgi:biopolymer transport protein ExbD
VSELTFDLANIPADPSDDSAEAASAHDAMEARRRRKRRPEPAPMVLNIVSMIDVIFLLMTYFLLTAKFTTREEAFEVKVPERLESSSSVATPPADPFALPTTTVVLTVTSLGDGPGDFAVFCDSPAITGQNQAGGKQAALTDYATLTARARAARGTVFGEDQRFLIRPAADARWEHALGVLNAIKRAGYNNARFANPLRAGS